MVYFIKCAEYIKIGYTIDLENRLKAAKTFNPFPLEVLRILDGDMKREKQIHKELSKFKHEGEWLIDCEEVRGYIKTQTFADPTNLDKPTPMELGYKHKECLKDIVARRIDDTLLVTLDLPTRKSIRSKIMSSMKDVDRYLVTLIDKGYLTLIGDDVYKICKLKTIEIKTQWGKTTTHLTFHGEGQDHTI